MISKQRVLDEIRRTAKENNDVPLGVARFLQETGIKESDWSGKFWARWGDALTEAGFKPNEFNAAYDEDFLLHRLASLTRELQKFPTVREMKMKSKSDATFPAAKTFARLGGKSELARKLREFCRENVEFDNILSICSAEISKEDSTEVVESQPEFGFVYLMKSGKFYKIGRSNAAGRREYEIAIQMPEKLTTVHVIRTDDPCGIEEYWHKRFAEKRKNGEWFELSVAEIQAFKRRRFM